MSHRFGAIFGSILAVALLLLYAVSAWAMILALVGACPGANCGPALAERYGEGFRYVLTTVGGLVSALVIAHLSITVPGAMPGFRALQGVSERVRTASNVLAALYLLVWASTGFAALVVGVMLYPNVIPTVSDLGTVWLGLAVAAGYAYFGLTPPGPEDRSDLQFINRFVVSATVAALEKHIANGKIIFDKSSLKDELLGRNQGQKVTENLQKLVVHLADAVATHIRVSSIIRSSGHHSAGRAVDIGNEEVAGEILPRVMPLVASLSIDELIFDAAIAGKSDRNEWNYDKGQKHSFDTNTLNAHKDHIHFSVLA